MEQAIDNRKIRGVILRLIVPVALENMLQILASFITIAMVGRLLASDISAQGLSVRIYNTCFALFRGIGIGATIQIAHHYGKNALGKCRRAAEQTYLTAVPLAILVAVVCSLFARPIVSLITKDPSLLDTAVEYIRVSIWAIPFMAIIAITTATFNGQGNTKTPMLVAMLLNLLNVGVSYVAIFGVGPLGGWGIMGAAYATVISQVFGCGLGLYLLYHKQGVIRNVHHDRPFFSIDPEEVKSIYSTGIPAALESLFWQFSALLVSKVILGYGNNHYAAYQLGLQAELITEMPAMGFTTAAATLSARAIAARDGELYRAYYRNMFRIAMTISLAATAVLLAFPHVIMQLLTDKPVLQEIGVVYLIVMAFSQIPQVLSKMYNGFIRSSGGKRVPMYISFVGIWVVRVPLILLVGWVWQLDIVWIWLVINLDQITRMAMSLGYIKSKKLSHCVERLQEQDLAPAQNAP